MLSFIHAKSSCVFITCILTFVSWNTRCFLDNRRSYQSILSLYNSIALTAEESALTVTAHYLGIYQELLRMLSFLHSLLIKYFKIKGFYGSSWCFLFRRFYHYKFSAWVTTYRYGNIFGKKLKVILRTTLLKSCSIKIH